MAMRDNITLLRRALAIIVPEQYIDVEPQRDGSVLFCLDGEYTLGELKAIVNSAEAHEVLNEQANQTDG